MVSTRFPDAPEITSGIRIKGWPSYKAANAWILAASCR
ncbi:Uncharacterised protein [Mycobacteroides abscessus subsp. abscessus]|nr:Uncharacterised protein [Mycobacteroides abscessus subsp. abscessus]